MMINKNKLNLNKVKYFFRSALNIAQEKKCPFCGGNELKKLDGKYIVTSLLECQDCKLNHRHPRDSEKFLEKFYQVDYSISNKMMTSLPNDQEINTLKIKNFPALRAYDDYIDACFNRDPKGLKIIDYGCSWGYNVYKLKKSGYDTLGYELSIPRAKFGEEKLDVSIYTDEIDLREGNDLFLSSHVIEHLPSIGKFIDFSKKVLKEDGIFMAFCPNGGLGYAKRHPDIWHGTWGLEHPNHLSVEFAANAFKNNPYLILTGDWVFEPSQIKDWDGKSQIISPVQDGKELLIIAKPNINIK